jgi:hypothetical protein
MNINKYQEALDVIKGVTDYEQGLPLFYKDDEWIVTLQELVDRATPKKPIIAKSSQGEGDSYCPICFDRILKMQMKRNYCQECGQALDWSKDEI